jgi:hypothetical protein
MREILVFAVGMVLAMVLTVLGTFEVARFASVRGAARN